MVSTPDVNEIPTPTVTHYQRVAEDFIKGFDVLVTTLPNLETTHPTTAKFVRSHLNISNEFIAAALAAVEQSPVLHGTQQFDTLSARNALQLLDALTPLLNRVRAFCDSLEYTLWTEKAFLTKSALQIYGVSKVLANDPASSLGAVSLTSHVGVMKRALGRRGPAKSKTTDETPVPPTPTPHPTT